MPDLATLAASDFEPLLHQKFRLVEAGTEIALELIEVSQTRSARGGEKRAPFILQFKSSPGAMRPQGIFRIEHEELGAIEVFAVPVSADESGCCYDVIFA
jgi:hypothetical protein